MKKSLASVFVLLLLTVALVAGFCIVSAYAENPPVTASDDIKATYDGTAHTVTVTATEPGTYTYEWKKDGVDFGTDESFTVTNVADSGVYTCKVYSGGELVGECTVNVEITPAELDLTGVELTETLFEYDADNKVEREVAFKDFSSLGITLEESTGEFTSNALGKHVITATFSKDNGNYVKTADFEWFIKHFVDLSGLTWTDSYYKEGQDSSTHNRVYDSKTTYTITPNVPDEHKTLFKNIKTLDTSAKNAGNYVARVDVEAYANEIHFVTPIPEYSWTIEQYRVQVSQFTWSASEVEYAGKVVGVTLTNLPSYVTATYTTDREAIEMGTYVTTATLVSTDPNYALSAATVVKEWTLVPAVIRITDVIWTADPTYDGEEHSISATFVFNNKSFDTSLVTPVYSSDSVLSATVVSDVALLAKVVSINDLTDDHYTVIFDPEFEALTHTWNVTPKDFDGSSIQVIGGVFQYVPGKHYQAGITASDEVLPLLDNVTFYYDGITDPQNVGKELVGTYRVTARVIIDLPNHKHFEVVFGPVDLVIKSTRQSEFKSDDGAVEVKVDGGLDLDREFSASLVKDLKENYKVYGRNGKVLVAYDIFFTRGGDEFSIDGKTVNVKILIPEQFRNVPTEELAVIYIRDDGTAEAMNARRDGDYMCFSTDHFSVYAIAQVEPPDMRPYMIAAAAILLVLLVLLILLICLIHKIRKKRKPIRKARKQARKERKKARRQARKDRRRARRQARKDKKKARKQARKDKKKARKQAKKDNKAARKQEKKEAAERKAKEAALAAEEAARKAQEEAERKAKEAALAAEEAARKAKEEAERAEREAALAAEEAERKAKEEAERKAKEEAERAEREAALAAEEAARKAKEEAERAEREAAERAAAEEAAKEAPVEEEPKTAVLVMGEDGKGATAVIGDETVQIRFRSSFMSRLIQSTESVQDFYTTIKNHILSYKGIKARGSWNYEAFNKGRVQLVKLNIKGKTLVVNLNLDPKEFNINKYHFVDCSDKPKFAKVPMMMKVRSVRALKYTLELIDEMMKQYELTQGEVPTVDYHMPYETTEELAKRGLVKVILPAGVTLSDDMTLVHVNVSELIESGTTAKTTEQIITADDESDEEVTVEEEPVVEESVEEAPVEEAPVEEAPVEEAPVEEAPVEEAPVEEEPVEEEPVVEEPKVEFLEDGTVHADATVADQLISDEEAEAQITVVSTSSVKRSGKLDAVNLDLICENFEDGEVVDVDALKAKHLISSKVGKIKILARGVMNKRLTVKASKFSLQAVKMITLAGGKAELEE